MKDKYIVHENRPELTSEQVKKGMDFKGIKEPPMKEYRAIFEDEHGVIDTAKLFNRTLSEAKENARLFRDRYFPECKYKVVTEQKFKTL